MTWPDGRCYEGEWSLDKMHGLGTYTHPDGKKYFGGWRNGQRHGEATVTTKEGEIKYGHFDNGKLAEWVDKEFVDQTAQAELIEKMKEIEKEKEDLVQVSKAKEQQI